MVAACCMTRMSPNIFLKLKSHGLISVCSSMERWPNLTFRLPNVLELDNVGPFSVVPFSPSTIVVATVAQDLGVSFFRW